MLLQAFSGKRRWVGGLGAATALLVWSSWQPPSLSSYAHPAEFAILNAPQLRPGSDSVRLQAQVTALPGISACTVRPDRGVVVVAFNPDSLSQMQLCQRLGLQAQPTPPANPNARQCPVPAGYVLALEKLRFALNLRRLFVRL